MTTHCEACGDELDPLDATFGRMHEHCVERLLEKMRAQTVHTFRAPVRFLSYHSRSVTLSR